MAGSKRDKIKMTPEEVAAYLAGNFKVQVATVGADGAPHLATLFYVLDDAGRIAFWTYASSQKIVNLRRDPRVSALVVSEDGANIDGIVSDRGLLSVFVERGPDVLGCPLDEIMTRKVCTCSPGDSVGAIMSLMTERRIRHVPVVDQDGRLCGIVSIGDVVKHHVDEIQREAADLREYISGTV